eukprot:jgi/Mesen1/8791/ME000527S08292
MDVPSSILTASVCRLEYCINLVGHLIESLWSKRACDALIRQHDVGNLSLSQILQRAGLMASGGLDQKGQIVLDLGVSQIHEGRLRLKQVLDPDDTLEKIRNHGSVDEAHPRNFSGELLIQGVNQNILFSPVEGEHSIRPSESPSAVRNSQGGGGKLGKDEDLVVEVVDGSMDMCTEESLRPDADDQATDCSSSFATTIGDSEGDTDVEKGEELLSGVAGGVRGVEAAFRDYSSSGPSGSRSKRPLSVEWKEHRKGIEWRCRWLELRMRELQFQASRYDQLLARLRSSSSAPSTSGGPELKRSTRHALPEGKRAVVSPDPYAGPSHPVPYLSDFEAGRRDDDRAECSLDKGAIGQVENVEGQQTSMDSGLVAPGVGQGSGPASMPQAEQVLPPPLAVEKSGFSGTGIGQQIVPSVGSASVPTGCTGAAQEEPVLAAKETRDKDLHGNEKGTQQLDGLPETEQQELVLLLPAGTAPAPAAVVAHANRKDGTALHLTPTPALPSSCGPHVVACGQQQHKTGTGTGTGTGIGARVSEQDASGSMSNPKTPLSVGREVVCLPGQQQQQQHDVGSAGAHTQLHSATAAQAVPAGENMPGQEHRHGMEAEEKGVRSRSGDGESSAGPGTSARTHRWEWMRVRKKQKKPVMRRRTRLRQAVGMEAVENYMRSHPLFSRYGAFITLVPLFSNLWQFFSFWQICPFVIPIQSVSLISAGKKLLRVE